MTLHDVRLHKDGDALVGRGGLTQRELSDALPTFVGLRPVVGLAERDRAPGDGLRARPDGERCACACWPTTAGWSCGRTDFPFGSLATSRCSTIRAYTSRAWGPSCAETGT